MRILGIDPGLTTTGFGIIEKNAGVLTYVASGTVKTDRSQALPERLGVIFEGVTEIISRYSPDCAAIEKVFVNVNPNSTLLLGQARGAALSALVAGKLPVHEFTALQIKQAVCGHGKAAKTQIQEMVTRLLNLPKAPGPDACDALGAAISHAHSTDALTKIKRSGAHGLTNLRVRAGRIIGKP